ncbi:MAG: sensor hybrid histidine kinase [Hyphomicrobiales bacterium]|nr:sensor hybrid histidine kinase [Hyphomicrobiales bacterium]
MHGTTRATAPDLLVDGGETGALMRALDWSGSPLEQPHLWPQSLRSVVGLLLASKFPMFVAWGPELGLLYNDSYAEILGAKHPWALGRRFQDVWREIWPEISVLVDETMAGNAVYREDLPLVMNRYGYDEQTWFTFSYSPVRDESGAVAGVYCACTETTEKVRLNQKLEAKVSETAAERDRVWLNSRDLLVVVGADGIFRAVNPAWKTILGRDPDELIGGSFLDFVWAEDAVATQSALDEAAAASDLTDFQNRFTHKDGTPRWISWRTSVEGDLVYAYGRDVTDTMANADALERSEARTRSIFETSYQFQGFLSPDGILLDANPASLAGISARLYDVVGLPLWDTPWFTGTPGLPEIMKAAIPRVASGQMLRAEFDVNLLGETRTFDFSIRPITNASGAVIGIVPDAIDITDQRRTEEALRQAQKMEAVGQLTGGVAHDFNNLLTIIRSSSDLLRRPGLSEDRRERYITAIADTVDRASKLTGQLLAFARRQALKPEVFDVVEHVADILDMMRTMAGARIEIRTEMSDKPCLIEADLGQFETAIINMAVNARDAMNGEGTLTVRVASVVQVPSIRGMNARVGDFVSVALSDTGSGIPADALVQIFEPFYTTKDVGKGTGLGLSQVYGFVKQSGGDVDVETDVGAGTTFTLYLPMSKRDATEAPRSEDRGGAELAEHGHGRRVLVVEDNADVGNFSTQVLHDLGYETVWASSAEDALKRLDAGASFDVVFSDVVMPGTSGVELAQQIRLRFPELPVVLTSGYSEVLAEKGTHGFDLLQKPYAIEDLSRMLRRVTQGRWSGAGSI